MIYSIGHGNRSWSQFLSILKENNGKYLVDVRSFPRSKFNPDFNQDSLEAACKDAGIKYLFLGDSLGGKPKKKSLYDHDGRADYTRMSEEDDYKASISRLQKASSLEENTFIMCSELCPSQCHRSKLIGKTLEDLGIHPVHIDKRGSKISQQEVIDLITMGQDDLFGESPSVNRSRGSYA
ncbi:DUF488 family protein [Paracoccus fistulariae]|uniref:DUF488 domain-containing protein n=1 Tax=Paracoccus fistulariae TaxID=658446 RepID=UPI0023313CA9|nr:DUF488 domain-containing protein [Paracoccus fistulariae]MDB6183255.1 DUF488 domain-containing protein [Paracoccus fistulariae]